MDEGRKGKKRSTWCSKGQPAVTHNVARQQNSGPQGPQQSPGGQRVTVAQSRYSLESPTNLTGRNRK